MRLIVPLQGIVQGRVGLFLGSVIPCALLYFLQFYLRRHRTRLPAPPSPPASPSLTPARLWSRNTSGPAYISCRAQDINGSVEPRYYAGLQRHSDDPYDLRTNPDGVIQLGLADNTLSLDLLSDWLESLTGIQEEEPLSITGIACYQKFVGIPAMKNAVAGFMTEVMGRKVSFNPSKIVLTAGATPAIEILSFCLADRGNAFLVPTPYYPGFDSDITFRTGIELVPVPCESSDGFKVNIPALERAYNQAKKQGLKVRAVLISNPSNPVGHVLDRSTLHSLLDFARENNIHLISDELFAGSVHGDDEFVSIAEVVDSGEFDKTRVHIIYGLSKDLCLPGFRVGVLYSYNGDVVAAATRLARFSSVSAPTQQLVMAMLSDTSFVQNFISVNRERIRNMYTKFVDGLKELGIECTKSKGGCYCWADMSHMISSHSESGELELWEKLLDVGKINSTPGSACHCIEPGWFRFCFTTLTEDDLPVVMNRIQQVSEICTFRR